MNDRGGRLRALRYTEVVLGVTLLGGAVAYAMAKGTARRGALLGVALSASSALLALYLKKWAVERSLQAAFSIVGIVFVVRLVVVAVGLTIALSFHIGVIAFAAGFFSLYFVLQWVEISYLLGERNKRNGGVV